MSIMVKDLSYVFEVDRGRSNGKRLEGSSQNPPKKQGGSYPFFPTIFNRSARSRVSSFQSM